jgi:hypothetical protein
MAAQFVQSRKKISIRQSNIGRDDGQSRLPKDYFCPTRGDFNSCVEKCVEIIRKESVSHMKHSA